MDDTTNEKESLNTIPEVGIQSTVSNEKVAGRGHNEGVVLMLAWNAGRVARFFKDSGEWISGQADKMLRMSQGQESIEGEAEVLVNAEATGAAKAQVNTEDAEDVPATEAQLDSEVTDVAPAADPVDTEKKVDAKGKEAADAAGLDDAGDAKATEDAEDEINEEDTKETKDALVSEQLDS